MGGTPTRAPVMPWSGRRTDRFTRRDTSTARSSILVWGGTTLAVLGMATFPGATAPEQVQLSQGEQVSGIQGSLEPTMKIEPAIRAPLPKS